MKSPSLPEPKQIRMPNPNDPEVIAARRRAAIAAATTGGRNATMLSEAIKNINGSAGMVGQ